ncbi:MAG: response regulator [Actinomycetota bacterium]
MDGQTSNGAIRVVVIDDHPAYAHGLESLLSAREWGLRVVGVGTTTERAERLLQESESDIILMNDRMPGIDSLEVVRRVRQDHPAVRVVIVSCDPHSVCRALRAGASGYVLKTAEVEEVAHILGVVASGGTAYSSGLDLNMAEFNDVEELTEDENMLLKLLSLGLTNDEIAREFNESLAVLKRNMSTLFRKIDVANRVQAAVFASKRGVL